MKTIIRTIFCLALLLGANTAFASGFLGVKADGEQKIFLLDDVLSIKASTKNLIQVNEKDGTMTNGFSVIKFGEWTESSVSDKLQENNNVRFFPNPVKRTIFLVGADADTEIVVSDIYGKIVLRNRGEKIDVETLNSGIYVFSAKGKSFKFIKE